MAFGDRTPQFREIVAKSSLPDAKRRKRKRITTDAERDQQALLSKEYLKEAYNVLNHITSLTRMLSAIRRPYLNVDLDGPTLIGQAPRSFDFNIQEQSWSAIRRLTNEERDQIDLQAKIIISKCVDRVKEMEILESKRAEVASKDKNFLVRLLPSRLKQDVSSIASASIAAHHASITYYLNRQLAEASSNQKQMQEERIKRQTDRTRTLGSGAAREAVELGINDPPAMRSMNPSAGGSGGWLGDASSSFASTIAATIGFSPSNSSPTTVYGAQPSRLPTPRIDDDDEDEYDDLELSSSQIQQFEAENANILRSVQDTLASVQQAESRLLDISALQMELVAHLTQQTELTDQLHEDAIATTATVEKSNMQLREAKRRAKDSRLYLLVFLLGASFALLFLHYY